MNGHAHTKRTEMTEANSVLIERMILRFLLAAAAMHYFVFDLRKWSK